MILEFLLLWNFDKLPGKSNYVISNVLSIIFYSRNSLNNPALS